MRLQLTRWLLVFATISVAAVAFGGETVSTRLDVYQDRWIVVWIPQTRVAVTPTPDLAINGGVAVDIVSGASSVYGPDVITGASVFHDERVAADVSVRKTLAKKQTLSAGLSASRERDFNSVAPTLSGSTELFDRMATLSASYSPSFEQTTSANGDAVRQLTFGQNLDLGWTQILDKRTSLTVLATGGWLACGDQLGCQANPYRWVQSSGDIKPSISLRERHPDQRGRVAGSVSLSRGFGPVALHAGYRYYADTWRVNGHTLRAAVAWEGLDRRLMLRAEGRGGWQSAASFFRDDYGDTLPEFRTSDRELAAIRDWAATGRVEWTTWNPGPFLRVGVNLRVTRMGFSYPDTAWADRGAWVIGGGIDGEL